MFLYLLPLILIIAADQVSKIIVEKNLELGQSITGIKGLFNITYVRNEGAAFGIMDGKTIFLVVVTVLIFAAMVIYILKYRPQNKWLMWSIILIMAGGIGNLIDRIAFGYVRDFIDLSFMRFPVFNIADCGVTVGAFSLALYILIGEYRHAKDRDDEFDSDTGCPQ